MNPGPFTRFLRGLAILAIAGALATVPVAAEVTTESQLKAAYLINFLKYVDWPESDAPITLCLFGRGNLAPYLLSHQGRQIAGRELQIRKISSAEHLAHCQEVFVPESEASHFASIIRGVEKQAILTVSDAEIFPRIGGAIAIIRAGGQLRFDINITALDQAGLRASPLMINLARQVTGTPQ